MPFIATFTFVKEKEYELSEVFNFNFKRNNPKNNNIDNASSKTKVNKVPSISYVIIFSQKMTSFAYSHLSNSQGGWNRRVVRKLQYLLNFSTLELFTYVTIMCHNDEWSWKMSFFEVLPDK